MPEAEQEPGVGCRPAALALGALVVFAALAFGVGLALTLDRACTGACEELGTTLLYAGGPVSAVFGVVGGAVMAAWPVDLTVWVVLAWAAAARSERRRRPVWSPVLWFIGAALVYGFALSLLVERA